MIFDGSEVASVKQYAEDIQKPIATVSSWVVKRRDKHDGFKPVIEISGILFYSLAELMAARNEFERVAKAKAPSSDEHTQLLASFNGLQAEYDALLAKHQESTDKAYAAFEQLRKLAVEAFDELGWTHDYHGLEATVSE
jgi:hypothetical protein